MKRETSHLASCNRCGIKSCPRLKIRNPLNIHPTDPCRIYVDSWGKVKMAELLLAHPQGLHEVLSSMPFKVGLNFKL